MMLHLFVHHDAQKDLDELWESDEDAAALIEATLDEIRGNEALLDALLEHDFGKRGDGASFHVNKWVQLWRQGKDLWRLKVWELENERKRWRIIYAYMPTESRYYVLGVAPREFDYDPNHPLSQRIMAAYEDL